MIFENTRSQDALRFWCKQVAAMKPGQFLEVDPRELRDIASYEHNHATFKPADRILGNLMGSAYTHSYVQLPSGNIRFARHENTGERRHSDPDDEFRLARINERKVPKMGT